MNLLPNPHPDIYRVLLWSWLDDRRALEWLADDSVDPRRKACLLNVLAMTCATPALMDQLVEVFEVRADRVHASFRAGVHRVLDRLTADPRQPFYRNVTRPHPIHRDILKRLPADLQGAARLVSYRSEDAPSLQLVIADIESDYTVADLDLDLFNPLKDGVSAWRHLWEVITNRRRKTKTDHLALYEQLRRGPAAPFLCYTLTKD